MIDRAFDEFGRLDILVNNAAFQMAHEKVDEFPTDEFDRTFRTNVYAMFWLCRAALPRMKAGACIINVASRQAYNPSAQLLAYAPTKAAIVNFTKALSKLSMKQSVRVNAVAPGPVWTPLIAATLPEEHIKEFGADSEYGRPAQPVEIAPVFVFSRVERGAVRHGRSLRRHRWSDAVLRGRNGPGRRRPAPEIGLRSRLGATSASRLTSVCTRHMIRATAQDVRSFSPHIER